MKTILHVGMIMAFLLALMPAAASAHTEGDPFSTDLLAGQDKDVGDVLVWNDETNLYVKYAVTESNWCLTETHLGVAGSLEGIPQTKKGNPIPGQFEFSGYHACETEVQYTIPLDGLPDDLYIAAHAVVKKYRSESGCIYSGAETQWYDPDASVWSPAVPTWVHPSWPTVAGATWIWRTGQTDPVDEYDTVPDGGWEFRQMYDLPATSFNINASLYVTADNSYSAAVNGSFVGQDGSMDKDGPDAHSWSSVESYDISSLLGPGANTLTIHALNYFRSGSYTSNPAGLVFKVCGCYDYFKKAETAWADGLEFPGKNWATYFTYTVQSPPS